MNKLFKKSLLAVVALTSLTGSAIAANADWVNLQNSVTTGGTVSLTQNIQAETDNTSIVTSAVNTVINGNLNTLSATLTGAAQYSMITSKAGVGYSLDLNNITIKNGEGIYGGAVDNTLGTTLNVNNALFDSNFSFGGSDSSGGGAIANRGTVVSGVVTQSILNVVGSEFENNVSQYSGGAIYNANGIANVDNTIFTTNYSDNRGGAIGNYRNSELTVKDSSFDGNRAHDGGAIVNTILSGNAISEGVPLLTVENSSFSGNQATITSGGAIYSYSDKENTIKDSTFDSNNANVTGGAVYNEGKLVSADPDGKLTITNSKFTSNTATTSGGAIGNKGDLVISGSGTKFEGNYAKSGGAIANIFNSLTDISASNVSVSDATFDANGYNADTNAITESGGAIYNQNVFSIDNSTFTNNQAKNGGAIYNQKTLTIKDSSFLNNTADSAGGAIFGATDSVTSVFADTKDVIFGDGAAADKEKTDSIYLQNNAILNMSAKDNNSIIVNSNISGSSSVNKAQININPDADYQGKVVANSKVKNANITLHKGTLHFTDDYHLESSDTLNLNGGTLSLLNGAVTPFQMGEMNINGTTNLSLDVDLANKTMDSIDSATTVNYTSGALNVNHMKAITDNSNPDVAVMFTDNAAITGNGAVTSNGLGLVEGPIYKYNVTQKYEDGTGIDGSGNPIARGEYFVFNKTTQNSASILAGPVAAQVGGFLLMDNIYKQAFANFDLTIAMTPEERQAIINNYRERNYFIPASERTGSLSPRLIPEERKGVWFRPYNNYEHVSLKRGPRVSNVTYGALIGGDSELAELRGGWQGFYSSYIAYNGAHQAFDGISMWQNGGTVGVSGAVFKGNFFTAGTANVGASAAHANTFFGDENINLLMTGAALKSGYNWSLKNNRFIIQPSFMTSYTFVNTFDYTSASGYNVESDPLHAIELIPGLKFIANTKNGWQPYIGVNMVWNIIDQTKFYVQDAILDRLAVKPYIEYGIGVQKRKGERCTGFGQAMIRNGGREGVAFTLGMRWAVGK